MSKPDSPAALELRALSKTFGSVRALADVDLTLGYGEIRALLGANGSGKSTLIKLLAGYHRPDGDAALILVDGSPVDPTEGHGIEGFRFIHQDLALIDDLTVAENVDLIDQDRPLFGRIDQRAERSTVGEEIERVGLDVRPDDLVRDLSPSQRTMVAVIRAFRRSRGDAKVLVLDEVTASLPPTEVNLLRDSIRRIEGVAVIFVSHRLEEVLDICDSVTVLRDGRVVSEGPIGDYDEERLVHEITGREPQSLYPYRPEPRSDSVLRVRGLKGAGIEDVDLEVHAGEIVGLASLDAGEGAAVLRLIYGDVERSAGDIEVAGSSLPRRADPRAASRIGLSLVADRHEGGIPNFTIRENLMLNGLEEAVEGPVVSKKAERRISAGLIERFGVRTDGSESRLDMLSGGNQQKVVIAKSIRMDPRVLLLEDPTRGVDIGSKATIYEIVREAAAEGTGVLMCSSEFDEICGLCHRVIVLSGGRDREVQQGPTLTPDVLLERCFRVASGGAEVTTSGRQPEQENGHHE
jgi:ribose transport system ATP-binding protein